MSDDVPFRLICLTRVLNMETENAATSGPKLRGRPFRKGQSGNPNGRPVGCRNKASILLGELIDNEGREIVRAMIDAAKNGDTAAGRCLIERLVPPRKDRAVSFTMPSLESAADAPLAMAAIVSGVASGDLTASEANDLAGMVEKFARAIEICELERRVADLEGRAAQ